MLTYNLDQKNKSLYLQLYEKIKKDILDNKLEAKGKLPSKRKLANHLGIALITVENAYEQLIAEGYIYTIEKKGYYVSSLVEKTFELHKQSNNDMNKILDHEDSSYYDLKSAEVDINLFPFSIWSKLMRQVISEKNKKLLVKTDSFGVFEFRLAIAKHLYSYHGLVVEPNQIIIGAGSEYLYSMIIKLLGFDNIFALENPGYKKISKVYESNNVKTRYIELDSDGIDITKLENINVVHVSPAHQFPTGIVMPIKRKLELLNWANEKENRIIIEDDYDSEFRFKGVILPSIMSIDKNEKVIYLNTFSKTIAPSIRISYMIIPKKYLSEYKNKLGFFSCTVPSFEQYTLARFIDEGYFERHLNKMKTYYRKKIGVFFSLLKESRLNNIAEITYKDSGLHFLLKLDTNINNEIILKKAYDRGVKLNSLEEYDYYDKSNKKDHIFIINFSLISELNFQNVIKIFEDILFETKN
ncbi:MAG: PLP-dependent aminotransferase family protein [Spirochaetaceae bacterium]|nr:PLP-dependent aminotransferase family protein [Spirochaetaceae bacterium]